MRPEIIVAIITSASTLVAAIVSIIMNNRILGYKIDELTKKVEKHNNLIERMTIVERDLKTTFNRVDEIKQDINDLRKGATQ